jgi:methylisocitrate lyase
VKHFLLAPTKLHKVDVSKKRRVAKMAKGTSILRQLLSKDEILVVPGVYDALTAIAAVKSGFEAVYMTGSGAATALAGVPDIGLVTATEMVMKAGYIADAVPVPVISDADTGYGNAINVMRTVHQFERAGVAAIHLEDQVAPKRCGHVAGKQVIPMEEATAKIRAAVAARNDPEFVIIARVDSRSIYGFDDAVRRGRAYLEAGADVIFPEALESREEFAAYAREVNAPLFANMTEFGRSPYLSAGELQEMGYKMVIFPTTAVRVALKAVLEFYFELRQTGTQTGFLHRMLTRQEYYDLIGYERYNEYERQFLS